MLLLLAVCAGSAPSPVFIERPRPREPRASPSLPKVQVSFWTEYGEGWRDLFGKLDPDDYRRAAMYEEDSTDMPDAQYGRFMFFAVKGRRDALSHLWLLKENPFGRIEIQAASGSELSRHTLAKMELDWRGRLKVTWTDGSKSGTLVTPSGDRQYYQEILDFYENVFLCKEHGFTHSDFLVWSLKHSYGVDLQRFNELGLGITMPVRTALTGRNVDFLVQWFKTPASEEAINEVIGYLAHNSPASVFSLLRAVLLEEGVPTDPNRYLRQDSGATRLLKGLMTANGDPPNAVAEQVIEDFGNDLHIDKLLNSEKALKKFHESPYWFLATLTCVRMARALTWNQNPHVARIAFATMIGLRSVIARLSLIDRPKYVKPAQVLQMELSDLMLCNVSSWLFDTPPDTPRSAKWLDESKFKGIGKELPPEWPDTRTVTLLRRMCDGSDSREKLRIDKAYSALIGDNNDWKNFNPAHWRKWTRQRFLAEHALYVFLNRRGIPLTTDLAIAREEEGKCPRFVVGDDGKVVRAKSGGSSNIDDELLNALKTLSRDLRRSRGHNRRLHKRW